jgi:hypothetical protein
MLGPTMKQSLGQKKICFKVFLLLKGIEQTTGVRLLKKKSKINPP